MKFFNWNFLVLKTSTESLKNQLLLKLCLLQKKQNSLKITHLKEMIQNASDWTSYFLQAAPQLDNGTYQKDEIYMFCCWILLDYGVNHGYLDKHSNRDCFYSTIIKQYVILANIINQIQNSLCLELTNINGKSKKC